MRLLWNFCANRDRELAFAADFVVGLRFFGLSIRRTFIGVMVTETTPGRILLQSDVPRTRTTQPAPTTVALTEAP